MNQGIAAIGTVRSESRSESTVRNVVRNSIHVAMRKPNRFVFCGLVVCESEPKKCVGKIALAPAM
jgi:hypothetical protein